MEFINMLIPILITLVITFFIGFERQNIGKSAGVTAHVFIAIASCSIALLQRYLFNNALELSKDGINITLENQRIIAQVLTGVGFLGAGIIMKEKDQISGLTTATTLFSSAVIGIIIGMNYHMLGATLGIIIILFTYIRDLIKGINPLKKRKKECKKDENE